MAKINLSKAEEALSGTLHKITVDKLLEEADSAKKVTGKDEKNVQPPLDEEKSKQLLLSTFQRDLLRLYKKDHAAYKKAGITKKHIENFTKHPEKCTATDWKTLEDAHKKVISLLKIATQKSQEIPMDKLIEQQRQKQSTKRFNVSDKWLPLT